METPSWIGAALLAAVVVGPVWAGTPIVFRAMDPVAPGETVLLYGDRLGQTAQVDVARLDDMDPGPPGATALRPPALSWHKAEILAASPECVQAVIPPDLKPGLFVVRLRMPEGATEPIVVNRPRLWWAQGDIGMTASPGGWVRVFGKCLSPSTTVWLKGPSGARQLASQGDAFTHRMSLPRDTPAGTYALYAHTGGGPAGWSEPVQIAVELPETWPSRVHNVLDYGATGQGQKEDMAGVQAALAAIGKEGGGVLYFPRGRYRLTGTLVIPPRTVLRGEGRDLVCLFWPDTEDPPAMQIQGTHHFGLEDLTLYCSHYAKFLVADQTSADAGHVHLRRLVVRANRYYGHLKPEEVDKRFRGPDPLAPLLLLGGKNVEVTDCDLYSSGQTFWMKHLRGARLAGNTFSNGRHGWYTFSCCDGVIFENNRVIGGDLMATGGGIDCLAAGGCSQHIYFSDNRLTTMFGWDREAMTSDAGGGYYFGKLASCQGTRLVLAREAQPVGNRPWEGAGVFIFGGRGAGQYRQVVTSDGKTQVTIDRPWDVEPDADSVISITMLQRRYLLLRNEIIDAGIAIQFYGTAVDHIVAGNRSTRSGGFHNIGKQYSGYDRPVMESPCHQPSWFVQFLENEIDEGNAYRAGANNADLASESHVAALAWPPTSDWPWPYNRGTVIRGNRLRNNAHIAVGDDAAVKTPQVVDCLVENNVVCRSRVGIHVGASAARTVLRGNRFEQVVQPVQATRPAER